MHTLLVCVLHDCCVEKRLRRRKGVKCDRPGARLASGRKKSFDGLWWLLVGEVQGGVYAEGVSRLLSPRAWKP